MLEDLLLLQKRLVGKRGEESPADPTVSLSFRGQDGVDAIRRWLKESWILSEAFSRLTVTVDGFQGIGANVRELAGRCSNNGTVLFMELFEFRHQSAGVHPFEVTDPRSCQELRPRVLSQRMKVKVIDDIRDGIGYRLVALVSVPSCGQARSV